MTLDPLLLSLKHMYAHVFLSVESLTTAFHCKLFVAWPGLVLGWLKSQVLHQILQCHISPLAVGAKAAQSLQTDPPRSTAQWFKWIRQWSPTCSEVCVCVCMCAHSLLMLSPFIGVGIFILALCGFACGRRKLMAHVYERACSLMSH